MNGGAPREEVDDRSLVRSLTRGLDVILAFSNDRPRMSVSQVAAETGLSRPTARRMLLTLEAAGFARRDDGFFALTPRVLALGYAYLSSLNLVEIAQPQMERVVDQLDASCSLATLDREEVVYVIRVPTQRIMSLTLATGTRLPAHATSLGHVLLAGLSGTELDRYLAAAELAPLTPHTITDPAQLRQRLAAVREQGWAIVRQELELGIQSVSAPVLDADERVIASVGLSVMTATVDGSEFETQYAPAIVEAAGAISRELGAGMRRQGLDRG